MPPEYIGVERIISSGADSGFFQGRSKGFLPGGTRSGEISFYQLETKKITFFYQEVNRKIANFQIQGCKPTLPPSKRT